MSKRRRRSGLTLLEVILAVAIFGLAMAAIGQLIRLGLLSAASARDITTAQLLCETKLNELSSGVYPVEPVSQSQIESNPDWLYSVQLRQIQQQGLVEIKVTVMRDTEGGAPLTFELVRWISDPGIKIPDEDATEQEMEDFADAAASSSGDTTGNTGGGNTGGGNTGGGNTGGTNIPQIPPGFTPPTGGGR